MCVYGFEVVSVMYEGGNGCGAVSVNGASNYLALGDILFVLGFHSLVLLYKSSKLRE